MMPQEKSLLGGGARNCPGKSIKINALLDLLSQAGLAGVINGKPGKSSVNIKLPRSNRVIIMSASVLQIIDKSLSNKDSYACLHDKEPLSKYLILGIILFCIAYIPYALNNRYLFDDGVWLGQKLAGREASKQQLFELGRPFLWYMVDAMDWFQQYIGQYFHAARIYGFFCYLSAYILSMHSLWLTKLFSTRQSFWIASISALAPLNFSRACEINTLNYGTTYLLFIIGTYASIKKWRRTSSVYYSFLSMSFLFFSYAVESFIILGLILWIPFYIDYRLQRAKQFTWKAELHLFGTFLLRNPHFWIPIFATLFVMKNPTGIYANTNAITFSNFIKTPFLLFVSLIRNFSALFNVDIYLYYTYDMLAYIFCTAIILFIFFKKLASPLNRLVCDIPCMENLKPISVVGISALVMSASLFPYILVGKLPVARQFEDRFQLTFALTIGPVLFFLVSSFVKKNVQQFFLSAIIVLFTAMTSLGYQFILYNSHIRDAISEVLSDNSLVISDKTVLFNIDMSEFGGPDILPDLFFMRMQMHEYNEILLDAYEDTLRAGYSYNWNGIATIDYILTMVINKSCRYPNYLCTDQHYDRPQFAVVVRRGERPLAVSSAISDQLIKLTSPLKYKALLRQAIKIFLVPIPN